MPLLFEHLRKLEWFRTLRAQCAVPIAMGELFTNPDGGLTPAIKLAYLCAEFGVQEWSGFTDAHREVFPGCPEESAGTP